MASTDTAKLNANGEQLKGATAKTYMDLIFRVMDFDLENYNFENSFFSYVGFVSCVAKVKASAKCALTVT